MPNEAKTAQKLQERLEANRELVKASRHGPSMSSGEAKSIEPRLEEVECREACGRKVEVTVLYRLLPTKADPETLDWVRGPVPPVMCEPCAAKDAAEFSVPTPTRELPVEDWLRSVGVNTRKHGHATIDNFDAADAPKAPLRAETFLRDVLAAGPHDRVEGLYLVGESKGTGKTHLAVGIMRAVREARPETRVVFDPADRLITRVQDSYGTGDTDPLVELRRNADLYVLDDLGREKATDNALRILCTILDEREGAPTVITSNYLPHELGDRHAEKPMWERVASRLGDAVYRYVAVEGRDRRFVQEGAA